MPDKQPELEICSTCKRIKRNHQSSEECWLSGENVFVPSGKFEVAKCPKCDSTDHNVLGKECQYQRTDPIHFRRADPWHEAAASAPTLPPKCDKCGKEIDANITYWVGKKYHATCYSQPSSPAPVLTPDAKIQSAIGCLTSGLQRLSAEDKDRWMRHAKNDLEGKARDEEIQQPSAPVLPVPPRKFSLCERHQKLIGSLLPDDWCGACDSAQASSSAVAPTAIDFNKTAHNIRQYILGSLQGQTHWVEDISKILAADAHLAAPAIAGRTQGDLDLIDKEIAWCRENPLKNARDLSMANPMDAYQRGFIKGLEQAKFILAALRAREAPAEKWEDSFEFHELLLDFVNATTDEETTNAHAAIKAFIKEKVK